jgi:hypothetical protein
VFPFFPQLNEKQAHSLLRAFTGFFEKNGELDWGIGVELFEMLKA